MGYRLTRNCLLNVGDGDILRDFADASGIKWPVAVVSFLTGGSENDWTLSGVSLAAGLPVQPATGAVFVVAINNVSLPLPTNAAAETGGNLATIAAAVNGTLTVQGTVLANPPVALLATSQPPNTASGLVVWQANPGGPVVVSNISTVNTVQIIQTLQTLLGTVPARARLLPLPRFAANSSGTVLVAGTVPGQLAGRHYARRSCRQNTASALWVGNTDPNMLAPHAHGVLGTVP